MITIKDVDYLIGTYELPEKAGKRIRSLVESELRTIGFPSFDGLYQRIGELVERFSEPWGSRKAVRLDQIPENRSRSLHEVFGIESRVEEETGEESDGANENISLYEAVNAVSAELDSQQRAALEYLARGSNGLKVSPELIRNVPQIAERLDEVIRTYEREGRIIFPQRPIVEIHWNPHLWVKFGPRHYKGNPLAFFNEHLDVYEGMSRYELFEFDGGLYRALGRSDQLTEAIPTSNTGRPTSNEKQQAIVDSYQPSGCNVSQAARMLEVSQGTVLKYWRKAGLRIAPPRNRHLL